MKKPQIIWTKEKIDLLKSEYPNGDKKQLCQTLGVTYEALKSAAKKNKVKSEKDKRLYKLKPLMEDTLNIWYWLGFIMADGNISNRGQLRISLHIDDIEHLKILSLIIDSKVLTKKVKTAYGTSNICITVCDDIKYGIELKNKLNITTSKTYNAPKLNFLKTKEQALSFFIGFSDGDGMIGWRFDIPYLLRINCHYNWLKNFKIFKSYLKKFKINTPIVNVDKRGYSVFSISTSSDILKIRKWAIDNNIPLMKRKWFTENKPSAYKIKIRDRYNNIIKLIKDGNTYQQLCKKLNVKKNWIYQYIYLHKELYSLYKKIHKIEVISTKLKLKKNGNRK